MQLTLSQTSVTLTFVSTAAQIDSILFAVLSELPQDIHKYCETLKKKFLLLYSYQYITMIRVMDHYCVHYYP